MAPLHVLPLNVTVPAQLRSTAAEGVMPESEARADGVYAKDAEHEAGMPLPPSMHWKPSAAPVPVHPDPQDTSFLPEAGTHLPPTQSLSCAQ
jgi:hypothetical protein